MKNLSERVRLIISENNLKQKEFADKLNVTQSHVSKLLHGTSGMSASTANLIEQLFGYSSKWILSGEEPKLSSKYKVSDLSALQRTLIDNIEHMTDAESAAVHAFIKSLDVYKSESADEK